MQWDLLDNLLHDFRFQKKAVGTEVHVEGSTEMSLKPWALGKLLTKMTQDWLQQTSDWSSLESGKIWEIISLVEN